MYLEKKMYMLKLRTQMSSFNRSNRNFKQRTQNTKINHQKPNCVQLSPEMSIRVVQWMGVSSALI
jgi:hypothetical protein